LFQMFLNFDSIGFRVNILGKHFFSLKNIPEKIILFQYCSKKYINFIYNLC
jgi:hypothetical protein